MKITFIFSCSGMLRDVPECSGMFHVPGIIDAPFFCPFLVNNDVSILAKWDKLTGARQSNYMSHPHVHAKRLHPRWNQQPWSPEQIWRMEQAGEMVGQVNGEFYSFNDNTLSYGYISSFVDLFLVIDSFYAIFRGNLRKGRTWRNGACFQEKPSVKLP